MGEPTTPTLQTASIVHKPSPLFRLGASVLLMYLCGIGVFLWSINFRCRIRDMTSAEPVELSYILWHVEQRGKYAVILNYVRAELTPHPMKVVTFATASTYPDLLHVPEICRRWAGPMSIAVYVPGSDFKATLKALFQLRLAQNPCVRQNVTWHLYYDVELGPSYKEIRPPEVEAEIHKVERLTTWPRSSFRTHVHLPFPANTGRNVAKSEAKTTYVLTAEPWLYPSATINPRFFDLPNVNDPKEKAVYALPIFKSTSKENVPQTKPELLQLLEEGKVTVFTGSSDCKDCFSFPNATGWMETDAPNTTISVYNIVKKSKDFGSWQPYYISTKDVPDYDEEMALEGRYDRLSQATELCLQQYNFYVLDNAFLVHVPHEDSKMDERIQQGLIQHNRKVNSRTMEALMCRYGVGLGC